MAYPKPLPLTKLLLSLLVGTGRITVDFYVLLHDLKFHRGNYLRGGHALVKEYQRLNHTAAARRALTQLRHTRYLTAQKIGQRLVVTLTAKGLAATLAAQLRHTPPRSDKLYTVVVFDVPQSQDAARRQFRWLLRQGGFAKLQQSVWVSSHDVYELVAQFITQAKLKSWVNIFQAKNFFKPPNERI